MIVYVNSEPRRVAFLRELLFVCLSSGRRPNEQWGKQNYF